MLVELTITVSDLRCTYLLFVATRSEEEALRLAAADLGITVQERLGAGEMTYLDLGEPGIGRVFATRSSIGPFGHGGSASRAIYCMAETSAVALISVGMAFGVDPSRQRLGDVIVSTALLPYDNRDVRSDVGLPIYRYHRVRAYPSSESLRHLFARARTERGRAHDVHFGALLTGAAHIGCRVYRDHLIAGLRGLADPIVGGEMEGMGLLGLSAADQPAWIVVKGICDFADEDRDEVIRSSRSVACYNAARFVLEALQLEGQPAAGSG